jgi:hypothetical protein
MVSAALPGCATSLDYGGALTAVPYDLEPGGRIVVEVSIDDRGPFRFALDTAASGSFVFSGPIETLGLELDTGRMVSVYGAVASGSFPLVEVGRLRLGDVSLDGAALIALTAQTPATRSIDGVLGADFLRRYSVGFSAGERVLRLFSPGSLQEGAYRGWASVPLEPRFIGASREPLHFLEIEIAAQRIPALLDLGAGLNVLNPSAAFALRLSPNRIERAGELADALGAEPVLARFSSQQLRTGRVSWRNELFLIADMAIFSTLDYADRPLAILGSGLFNQRDFLIDLARERLLVRNAMPELEEEAER